MQVIAFGGERHERVAITVRGYESPERTGDYHDDNWVVVEVSVAAGSFRGGFQATFQVAELVGLQRDLADLHKSLSGEVTFKTLEAQLTLRFVGNGKGSIQLTGQAYDQPGIGNCLSFSLDLDQTQIGAAIRQMNEALKQFPLRDV